MWLVWELGTRVFNRKENDYYRLVALTHPALHSHSDPKTIRAYSQHFIDLIDLVGNDLITLPVEDVLEVKNPLLRFLAQRFEDNSLLPIQFNLQQNQVDQLVLTYDGLIRNTPFVDRLRSILHTLEENYHSPVDLEFTIQLRNLDEAKPKVYIYILQCRPQAHLLQIEAILPINLPEKDVIFSTGRVVPHGHVKGIRYILFCALPRVISFGITRCVTSFEKLFVC